MPPIWSILLFEVVLLASSSLVGDTVGGDAVDGVCVGMLVAVVLGAAGLVFLMLCT